jgi:hypothetical protein
VTGRQTEWADRVPDAQWRIYQQVIEEAQKRGIPFALGGAFAIATYTGYWRNTKDLDLYVLPEYRERMIQVLTDVGLTDYYDENPYDRWWIYRGHGGDTIVDIIWAMANHRSQIDELWMSGPEVVLHGYALKALPAEAMLWDKLYIMQRDRCDWPDVLNLLYAAGREIRWEYILRRMGADAALLAGVLSVFAWLAPGLARELPEWLWGKLRIAPPLPAAVEIDQARVSLLDRRPWFGADRKKLQDAA